MYYFKDFTCEAGTHHDKAYAGKYTKEKQAQTYIYQPIAIGKVCVPSVFTSVKCAALQFSTIEPFNFIFSIARHRQGANERNGE